MKFTTRAHAARGQRAFVDEAPPADAAPLPAADTAPLSAAARACGVLLLVAGLIAALGYVGGQVIRGNGGEVAAGGSDTPPRDPALVAGMRGQVQQMRDRGIIVAIHDGDPTIVVVSHRYLANMANLEEELPLYGGHFVGFADDYAWLINRTHRVRLVRDDGTEIGRREHRMTDAQVQAICRENRRLRDAGTAGTAGVADESNDR